MYSSLIFTKILNEAEFEEEMKKQKQALINSMINFTKELTKEEVKKPSQNSLKFKIEIYKESNSMRGYIENKLVKRVYKTSIESVIKYFKKQEIVLRDYEIQKLFDNGFLSPSIGYYISIIKNQG